MIKECRSCGAPVRWVVNEKTGKKMALNPAPIMREGTRFTMSGRNDEETGDPVVHAVKGIGTGLAAHFSTCPDAADWRGRGR